MCPVTLLTRFSPTVKSLRSLLFKFVSEWLWPGTASQLAKKVTNVRIAVEERPFRAA